MFTGEQLKAGANALKDMTEEQLAQYDWSQIGDDALAQLPAELQEKIAKLSDVCMWWYACLFVCCPTSFGVFVREAISMVYFAASQSIAPTPFCIVSTPPTSTPRSTNNKWCASSPPGAPRMPSSRRYNSPMTTPKPLPRLRKNSRTSTMSVRDLLFLSVHDCLVICVSMVACI